MKYYQAAGYAGSLAAAALEMARKRKMNGRGPGRPRKKGGRSSKRNRSRTVTKTRTRGRQGTTGEYDLSKRNYTKGGRMRRTLRNAFRMIESGRERVNFVATRMSRFGGAQGSTVLSNRQSAAGQQVFAPCYLYDITSCMNISNGTIVNSAAMQRLNFTTELSTASALWNNQLSDNWILQYAAEAPLNSDNYPEARSFLSTVNFRAMFYSAGTLPTRIQIDVIKLKDDRLIPAPTINGNVTVSDPFHVSFWQYMMKKYMYNPIEMMDGTWRKYVKYLKRMTLYLDPKETTDPNSARYKEVSFYYQVNKQMDYRWNVDDRVNLQVQDTQVNTEGSNRANVHPKHRIFILVRAIAGLTVATDDSNTANSPSFDWYLKTYHKAAN